MTKRLAITVSGAVSLGSFEAGVMFEVLDAIDQHNATAVSADDRIEVDVLTGASAGGMTACLTAQKLLFEAGRLSNPYDNDLFKPWVEEISLDRLLRSSPADDPTKSMLSSSPIDTISRDYLTKRYGTGSPSAPSQTHRGAARKIKLGLAMSNLNGVDYQHAVRPAKTFVYTRYQDTFCVDVDATATSDRLVVWEPIRAAAVACGAFPFAFRPRDLARALKDFADPALVRFPADPSTFTYTDGGVFQNEPLGLAKNLVDMIDEHQDVDDRYYLFVSPGPRLSTRSNGFNEANASLKATLLAIVEAIFNQARFHDWITAERVNDQIRVFNMRAEQLQQQMLSRAVNEAALLPAISALLPLLLAPDEQRAAELRLQQQFAAEYATLAAVSPTAGDTWIRAILVLEAAADLGARDEMNILGVTAEPSELASSAVVAFAGFIDRRYRLHDYDVGRRKAQAELTSAACPLGVLRYTPKPINPIDHSLDGLTLDTMDPRARQALADRLVDRADELLQEFGLNGALRWGIKQFFVKKEIAKLVGLGDAPSAPPDPNEAP